MSPPITGDPTVAAICSHPGAPSGPAGNDTMFIQTYRYTQKSSQYYYSSKGVLISQKIFKTWEKREQNIFVASTTGNMKLQYVYFHKLTLWICDMIPTVKLISDQDRNEKYKPRIFKSMGILLLTSVWQGIQLPWKLYFLEPLKYQVTVKKVQKGGMWYTSICRFLMPWSAVIESQAFITRKFAT